MGSMKVIFQLQDVHDYEQLVGKGILLDSWRENNSGMDNDVRYFNLEAGIFLYHRFFLSYNYQLKIGDFSHHPVDTKNKFGPAYVFGLGMNSADSPELKEQLERALTLLEPQVRDFRKRLTYSGTLFLDYGLLNKDAFRESLEAVLGKQ